MPVVSSSCGSWLSPVTTDLIVTKSIRLIESGIDSSGIWWVEGRPDEKGRYVLVRRDDKGTLIDITPPPFNVRTRVHEYGGGAVTVHSDTAFYVNYDDQRIYGSGTNISPSPITRPSKFRYADFRHHPSSDMLVSVVEDHTSSDREAVNSIATINITTGKIQIIESGMDFYSTPRISPDGKKLAWLTWNHPNMPWDGTELWLANIAPDCSITDKRKIAGGLETSIFQPEWSPEGTLHYISDSTGWWNLYRLGPSGQVNLCPMDAEFGVPHWVFGVSTYAFCNRGIVCAFCKDGFWKLALLHPASGELGVLDLPFITISGVRAQEDKVIFNAGLADDNSCLVMLDINTLSTTVLRRTSEIELDPGYISRAETISFPSANGRECHAFYYPPVNKDFRPLDGELPPLIVHSHGGPTGATSPAFSLNTQYWTSRGFAIVDVNYGGSTGYGREYREQLKGSWGIVDVEDCAAAANFLTESGKVDSNRLIITGGSAGGFTTLAALTFTNVFKAGASYYGVSDLEALARDTHKFESRYLDGLIGPYPERCDLYVERSPVHHVDKLSCPVIFFQGLEDLIVPPNQARMMVNALREKGIPVALIEFKGEQHGFRQAVNIKRSLEAELYFYGRVFSFTPAGNIGPVEIYNFDSGR